MLTTKGIMLHLLHHPHKRSPSALEHQAVTPFNTLRVRVGGKPFLSASTISDSEDSYGDALMM
jgi:hypothetical protein